MNTDCLIWIPHTKASLPRGLFSDHIDKIGQVPLALTSSLPLSWQSGPWNFSHPQIFSLKNWTKAQWHSLNEPIIKSAIDKCICTLVTSVIDNSWDTAILPEETFPSVDGEWIRLNCFSFSRTHMLCSNYDRYLHWPPTGLSNYACHGWNDDLYLVLTLFQDSDIDSEQDSNFTAQGVWHLALERDINGVSISHITLGNQFNRKM
jgi:hypothetical protein